jgi:hypothetical protein
MRSAKRNRQDVVSKMGSARCNRQDAFAKMQSTRCNRQDAIGKMQSARRNQQDAIGKTQSARCDQQDAIGKTMEGSDDSLMTLFSEIGTGMHLPRVLFVDLKPAMVDEVGEGPSRQLFQRWSPTPDASVMIENEALSGLCCGVLDIKGLTPTNLNGSSRREQLQC